ncbi:ester cyclase [filamentous cyanobacterium LEGE 11480]|uniref:Ester cyclase n=1 Tax=Romeriopsis navalis LEGE 11480 TaxID=2777977 RepID=A0A928VQQ6_9CYAN|nr:ester cyclase [Romeriopsis navalis]MBE9032007.1 ester cyclase [Romeriopsis navalis LEGE 11480]
MNNSNRRFTQWLSRGGLAVIAGASLLTSPVLSAETDLGQGVIPLKSPAIIQRAISPNLSPTNQEQIIKATVKKFYHALSNGGTVSLDDLNSFMAADWQSTPAPAGGSSTTKLLKSMQAFNRLIPDLSWEPQEMLVDGNRVIVRSIASGTPEGNFFGLSTDGTKSFRIMTIDIHTVEQDKLTSAFHVEDWHGAIRQLSPQ